MKAKAEELYEVIQDGGLKERVSLHSGPVAGLPSCPPGRHCIAHGVGPTHPCCKCGSTFRAYSVLAETPWTPRTP